MMEINRYLSVQRDPRDGGISLCTKSFEDVPGVKVLLSRESMLSLMEYLGRSLEKDLT